MRATMSLPVPLSPWMRTGTFAPASFVRRSRTARMPSVRPKTIASGGISPRGCTSVFTLLVVMAGLPSEGRDCNDASRAPNCAKREAGHSNLDYLIEGNQLTKEPESDTQVIRPRLEG